MSRNQTTGRVLGLVLLLSLISSSALAQQAEKEVSSQGSGVRGQQDKSGASLTPGPSPLTPVLPQSCDFDCSAEPLSYGYLKAGPVFPLGQGFLEERIKTGWTLQVGLKEPLCFPSPRLALFHEFGIGFITNRADEVGVVSNGFFRGVQPDDTHIHFLEQDGTLATAPTGSGELLTSRLERLNRLAFSYNLGGEYYPRQFQGQNRQTHFNLRTGFRIGYLDTDYTKTFNPVILEGIAEHFGHGHRDVFISNLGGKDPGLFIGVYGSIGVEFTYHDVRWFGCFPGTLAIGIDIEFAHDWFDLGDYAQGDDGLGTVTPMFTLAIAF